jgi:hypothetical protein
MEPVACLVCGVTLDAPPLLCSWRCADAAGSEINRNAARSRRIGRRDPDDALRYDLALRNGQLTAALMTLPKRFASAPPSGSVPVEAPSSEPEAPPARTAPAGAARIGTDTADVNAAN